jgi:hypothetical protein
MNRHLRSGSRTNRDRRDQAYARAVIAEATRQYNEMPKIWDGKSWTARHEYQKAFATDLERRTDEMLAATEDGGDIEVCPDCLGTGEVIRHVTDDVVREQVCLECDGRGWIK